MYQRLINFEKKPKNSFFLLGPRQTGKSFWLHHFYHDNIYIDLLKTDVRLKYMQKPHLLREELQYSKKTFVIIDEIQLCISLLDEIHWLIENSKISFCLCGSSARKIRRAGANMLGGRAITKEFYGLSINEIGDSFDLERFLNHGYLPNHYLEDDPAPLINAYINNYLKEEILEEGLTRSLPTFSSFLESLSFSDTEPINFTNIASDCGVTSPTVKEYAQILVDTLLGRYLPAYIKREKRKVVRSPKFYFYDIGLVNFLNKRGRLVVGSELFGKAFENWIFHELQVYNSYCNRYFNYSYWKLTSGVEVDFIVNNMEYAIEAKSSKKITKEHLKGLRQIIEDHPKIKKRIVVCLEDTPRITSDGIEIIPYKEFFSRLWDNSIL